MRFDAKKTPAILDFLIPMAQRIEIWIGAMDKSSLTKETKHDDMKLVLDVREDQTL